MTKKIDPEVLALKAIAKAISKFDADARDRIMKWVLDRFSRRNTRLPYGQKQ